MSARNQMPEAAPGAPIACSTCAACCCKLEVMVMGDDDIPLRLMAEDQWGGWVMHRLDDGWCVALDRNTMRCTIYARRPAICRDYEMGGSDCLEERSRSAAQHPPSVG
jgi:Fe-S-cluster containining protein